MSNNTTNLDNSPAKALDFGRALGNLIIPIPELIGSCIESKAILMDLLNVNGCSEDAEVMDNIKFVSLTLSLCADFFSDAMDEEAAKHTAAKHTACLAKFRELIKETIKK